MVGERQRCAAAAAAARTRHRRLVEDDAHVCERDPPAAARAHEDVVDPPRRARGPAAVEGILRVPGGAGDSGGGIAEAGALQAPVERGRVGRVAVEVAGEHGRAVEGRARLGDRLGDLRTPQIGRTPAPLPPVGAAGGDVEVGDTAAAEAGCVQRAGEHPARAEQALLKRLPRERGARGVLDGVAREGEQSGAVEAAVLGDAGAVGVEVAEFRRQPPLDARRHQLLQGDDVGVHPAQGVRQLRGARDHMRHVLVERDAEQADLGEAGVQRQDAQHVPAIGPAPRQPPAGGCG